MNSYEYFEGKCLICGHEGEVRHKNIWLIGSEGTDMCWPCEKHMLEYLRERQRHFLRKKVAEIKKNRGLAQSG